MALLEGVPHPLPDLNGLDKAEMMLSFGACNKNRRQALQHFIAAHPRPEYILNVDEPGEDVFLRNICFSDEAVYHNDGKVNRKN
ncbi:hypothetical protein FOCC_FOCC012891 [Frankliniella occidentalis]|nr:hypothetical protein FOCC_FOCC012891 [Frankliniella occidentalis]